MKKLIIGVVLGLAWIAQSADTYKVYQAGATNSFLTLTNVLELKPCRQAIGCVEVVRIKNGETNSYHANRKVTLVKQ